MILSEDSIVNYRMYCHDCTAYHELLDSHEELRAEVKRLQGIIAAEIAADSQKLGGCDPAPVPDTGQEERPAAGVVGFILWVPDDSGGQFFFRTYDSPDKRQYTDYEINVEDLHVRILNGPYYSLVRTKSGNAIAWSSDYMRRGT